MFGIPMSGIPVAGRGVGTLLAVARRDGELTTGHSPSPSAAGSNPCVQAISTGQVMTQFVLDPTAPLDTSCVAEAPFMVYRRVFVYADAVRSMPLLGTPTLDSAHSRSTQAAIAAVGCATRFRNSASRTSRTRHPDSELKRS